MMKLPGFLISFLLLVALLPELVHSQVNQRQLKSISEARGLAINSTILPIITGVGVTYLFKNKTVRKVGATLAVYGLVMGPSAGNFYAEDYLRGGLGVAARAGSGYLLLDATRELMGERVSEPLGWDSKNTELTDTRILVGAGIFLGSMIYNILSSKASVNEHNRKLGYTVQISSRQLGRKFVPMLTTQVRF